MDQVTGSAPRRVALDDLNGDGKSDIVALDFAGRQLYLYKNNSTPGNILLAAAVTAATGEGAEDLVISDLNNDSKPDIAIVNQFSHTMSIYTNMNSSTLPVQLLSFTGKKQTNKVELNWSTASEQNSDRFEIEKSTDGIRFYRFETVKSKGNSNVKHDYTAFDLNPSVGENFYRLRQVDVDGRFSHSKVVTVNYQGAVKLSVKLVPQPMQQLMTVNISGSEDNSSFKIYDLNGNTVKSYIVNGTATLPVDRAGLAAGIYFFKLISPKGTVLEKGKIIVQ